MLNVICTRGKSSWRKNSKRRLLSTLSIALLFTEQCRPQGSRNVTSSIWQFREDFFFPTLFWFLESFPEGYLPWIEGQVFAILIEILSFLGAWCPCRDVSCRPSRRDETCHDLLYSIWTTQVMFAQQIQSIKLCFFSLAFWHRSVHVEATVSLRWQQSSGGHAQPGDSTLPGRVSNLWPSAWSRHSNRLRHPYQISHRCNAVDRQIAIPSICQPHRNILWLEGLSL